jgi:AraC family transcriptional regulator of adaptative response / DNA-3-methyladenine glycosylase II
VDIEVRKWPARVIHFRYTCNMSLDRNICYLAIKSRDERFDGRFFTAVVTTGVYCRPICPAPTPRLENVRFMACAAAAEEAGFRPCLRCHPEASPGTPAWLGASTTVSRALRLISEGALDEAGVEGLAARLGMGERQLRRLFEKHLGASPISVAQTRRAHFAKKLIDETSIPVSEVAYCSGFASIRRFNAAFRTAYGKSPTELRNTKTRTNGGSDGSLVHLKLSYRPPFDWLSLLRFLRARAIPGVESIEDNVYRRTVVIGDNAGVIEVRHIDGRRHLLLSVPSGLSKGLAHIAERVRRLFDLKADPAEINAHLGRDKRLGPVVRAYPGLRVPGAWDAFEIGVRAILGQQVSVSAATTLSGRLVREFGEPLAGQVEGLNSLFPGPERLSEADLSKVGLPSKRGEAIRRFATAIHRGEVALAFSSSLETTIEGLTALPGIGPWTAHYIAMRAMGEPDAFPSSDLILRRAAAGLKDVTLTETELLEQAEPWRPWRAYAALYLWTSYANRKKE